MERSPLPLVMWFRVIERLLGNPEISPTELSQQIGVRRLATVRRMMRKTREALEGEAGAGGDPFDVAVREPVTCGAALSQIWKPKSTDGPRPLGGSACLCHRTLAATGGARLPAGLI